MKELKRPVSIDEALRYLLKNRKNKPSKFAGGWKMDDKELLEIKNELKENMYKFDWSFDLNVLELIWEMRDKRKTAKKVDVLNRATYIGMGRERTEQAINELFQMGKIIEINGGDADWDRLRVVDEEPFYRHRRLGILDDIMNPED